MGHERPLRRLGAAVFVLALITGGCVGAPGVQRSLVHRNPALLTVFNTTADKNEYSIHDAQVTLSVRFGFKPGESEAGLRVDWIAPDGSIHGGTAITRVAGTNMVNATLPIKGGPGAERPGPWKVRLYHWDEVVLERSFRIDTEGGLDNVGSDYRLPGDEMRREHW